MPDSVRLSRGRSVGLRMIPNVRDLKFEWLETAQQVLDERAQKMRESTRAALLDWATESGEASDYRENLPLQCLHPVGHWFEIPNFLLNGTLAALIAERPALRTLMLHNIDTLGANLDPGTAWDPSPRRFMPHLRSHPPQVGRPRRRTCAGQRPTAARRGARPSARRGRVQPFLLQHELVLDRYRPTPIRLRARPERSGQARRSSLKKFASSASACTPTSLSKR